MSNIMIIPADYYPMNTGFSNATVNLVKTVSQYCREIETHIFTDVELKSNPEINYGHTYRYNNIGKNNLLYLIVNAYRKLKIIKKYVKNNHIDIILLETNTFPILQNLLLKEYPNKVAVRIHSTADTEVVVFSENKSIGSRIVKLSIVKFMKKVRYILSTNAYYIDFVKKHFLRDNVYNVWNDKQYFILPNTCTDIPKISGEPNYGENYILTLGKMSQNGYVQKGLQDVIKAIYVMKTTDSIPTGFRLILIGNGIMREKLYAYARTLNVENYIQFINEASHDVVMQITKYSRAVILLSRYEGQSMFITEALALGKPLIVTSKNGMEEMITDHRNGLVVNAGNYIEAAECIKRIYNLDNDTITEWGNASKDIFEARFSPEVTSATFSSIVNMIIADSLPYNL